MLLQLKVNAYAISPYRHQRGHQTEKFSFHLFHIFIFYFSDIFLLQD